MSWYRIESSGQREQHVSEWEDAVMCAEARLKGGEDLVGISYSENCGADWSFVAAVRGGTPKSFRRERAPKVAKSIKRVEQGTWAVWPKACL